MELGGQQFWAAVTVPPTDLWCNLGPVPSSSWAIVQWCWLPDGFAHDCGPGFLW